MAIVDTAPALEVSILVDGKPLKEHRDDDDPDEEGTVTRWVEAVNGKNFVVQINAGTAFEYKAERLECAIYMDGNRVSGPVVSPGKSTMTSTGRVLPGELLEKYRFSDLETVGDGNMLLREAGSVAQLGSIKVVTSHVKKRGDAFGLSQHVKATTRIVSEKALKGMAISHTVQFEEAVKNRARTYIKTSKVADGPTFMFRYRSREALRMMYIIPRTPTAPPVEERDFNTLSRDELEELHKQYKAIKEKQQAAVKVKRERADNNPRLCKVARPSINSTQLEIDDEGSVREGTASTFAEEREVIELD
ncbi:hypothetical protein LTR86_001092 [Recurvomyces mirabilis]|nr:hypothetical protein LTR86_001092 [Recurvomyces mirabilis]